MDSLAFHYIAAHVRKALRSSAAVCPMKMSIEDLLVIIVNTEYDMYSIHYEYGNSMAYSDSV